MKYTVHSEVQKSLLHEINLVTRHYFHQNLDEIMNELHCQSSCVQYTSQPDAILKTIHHSGILYQRSDKIVSRLRDAVARYVQGTYGRCTACGGEIPSAHLASAPTSDLCPGCVESRFSSEFMSGKVN